MTTDIERTGRADRAGGAGCSRFRHPGQTRCRTTGSGRTHWRPPEVDDVAAARVLDQRRRELVAARDRSTATVNGLDRRRRRRRAARAVVRTARRRKPRNGDTAGPRRFGKCPCRTRPTRPPHSRRPSRMRDAPQGRRGCGETAGGEGDAGQRCPEKLTACSAELTVGRDRLAQQRATATDDELLVKAEADMEKARRATGLVADLGGELARCAPDTVAATLDEALRRVDALGDRHDEIGRRSAPGDGAAEGVRHRGAQVPARRRGNRTRARRGRVSAGASGGRGPRSCCAR